MKRHQKRNSDALAALAAFQKSLKNNFRIADELGVTGEVSAPGEAPPAIRLNISPAKEGVKSATPAVSAKVPTAATSLRGDRRRAGSDLLENPS